MKVYLVGGFVRDSILGLTPKDQDFVVVGATQDDIDNMISQGYQQVGADFPVFLHPQTGDEYALARVERKTGVGYGGFETTTDQVSLEDDLRRRDLTINAMAMCPDTKAIFDPYGGKSDLKSGILRHVSEAFAEDPLRVLRVARFAARYEFTIAPETIDLMSQIVSEGELEHLSPERVWVEMEKLFSEKHSLVGLKALHLVGALRHIFIDPNAEYALRPSMMRNISDYEQLDVLGKFIAVASPFRYDMMTMDVMRVPKHIQKAYIMFNKVVDRYDQFDDLSPENKLQFMKDIDAFGNTPTFEDIKDVLSWSVGYVFNATTLNETIRKAKSVDCEAIARGQKNGKKIADDIVAARLAAITV